MAVWFIVDKFSTIQTCEKAGNFVGFFIGLVCYSNSGKAGNNDPENMYFSTMLFYEIFYELKWRFCLTNFGWLICDRLNDRNWPWIYGKPDKRRIWKPVQPDCFFTENHWNKTVKWLLFFADILTYFDFDDSVIGDSITALISFSSRVIFFTCHFLCMTFSSHDNFFWRSNQRSICEITPI